MVYLDTSVALAHLLAEDRTPPASIWNETLVASRLLEYECWTRINAARLKVSHGEHLRGLLSRVAFLEMLPRVLVRALDPFPAPVRTLDAIHLASADFLRRQGQEVAVATYDSRMIEAAKGMELQILAL